MAGETVCVNLGGFLSSNAVFRCDYLKCNDVSMARRQVDAEVERKWCSVTDSLKPHEFRLRFVCHGASP